MRGLLPASRSLKSVSTALGWGSPISPFSSLAALDLLGQSWEMGPQKSSPTEDLFHSGTAVCPKAAAVHS